MVDCFFADPTEPGGFRKKSHPIMAAGDDNAILEATTTAFDNPEYLIVRVVTRKGDRIIFNSRDSR
jgi:hypothetical protein